MKPPRSLTLSRSLLVATILSACATTLPAATFTWVAAGDGNWNDAANWRDATTGTNGIPGVGDNARIMGSTLRTVTVNSAILGVNNVQLGNAATGIRGGLAITTGGTLAFNGLTTTDQANGVSLVTQTGGVMSGTTVTVGRINSGTNRYDMQSGTLNVVNAITVGGAASGGGGIGSGTFNQTGGRVTAGSLTINLGLNAANVTSYQFSGGTLSVTGNLVNGVVGSSAGTSLRVAGSAGTLLIGGNYSQNSNATLGVQVDNGGVTKLNLTSVSGTATMAGTLAADIKGSVALTSNTSFRVVEAETLAGDFATKPNSALWTTGTQSNVSGTRDAYVLSLNGAAEVGPDIVGSGSLTFAATDIGYATITDLSLSQPITLYLDVNAGGGSIAGMVGYFNTNGIAATQVSLGDYDIELTFTPTAGTSYFAWDLNSYNATATLSGISAVPEPASMALAGLGALGLLAFRKRRAGSRHSLS